MKTDPKAIQRARARFLRELFEPWSLRRLEARTGIGRSTLQSRLNGETAITMADIEILAPVARMTPEQLFTELREVEYTPRDLNPEPTD
jgi:transcriptional regulator with XRE-family HTH domain